MVNWRRRATRLGAVLAVAAVIGPGPVGTPASAQAATRRTAVITFYGWPDNDPPGAAIAYPGVKGSPGVRHRAAGGTGTYADPLTVAVAKGFLRVGTRVYVPGLRRYGIVEDDCASCRGMWLDVWLGGSRTSAAAALTCEDRATPDLPVPVLVRPGPGLPVDRTPLFDPRRSRCTAPSW